MQINEMISKEVAKAIKGLTSKSTADGRTWQESSQEYKDLCETVALEEETSSYCNNLQVPVQTNKKMTEQLC